MKYYSKDVKQRIKTGPNTTGLQLARLAIKQELSLREIAYIIGTARMTVYNWTNGRGVTNAYRPSVDKLIEILKAAPNSDAAWSTACTYFKRKH